MLQICIGSICLVSATPPTVLGQSFWNFTGTLQLSFDFTWEICHLLDITAILHGLQFYFILWHPSTVLASFLKAWLFMLQHFHSNIFLFVFNTYFFLKFASNFENRLTNIYVQKLFWIGNLVWTTSKKEKSLFSRNNLKNYLFCGKCIKPV